MPTHHQDKQHVGQESRERPQANAAIGHHVLQALGHPGDLHRVQVRPLWGDHYRVNVMTGADPTSVRIPHSYFVAADEQGNILASTPRIRKEYL